MDPLTAGAIAAPIVGGLIGANQASADRQAAIDARNAALAQLAGIKVPSIEDQQLNLQNYSLQGTINPLLEQVLQQGDSRLSNVNIDPRLKNDQMSALEQMSGLASGKIQPGDQAAFEMARRNAAAEAQAKQAQIMQEMQQRGQAGSGAELLAKLKASQSGADMLNQANMQQAQVMQQARMQALQQQANMASGIRTQDYGQQADLARARDAINQFNTQNAQSTQARNVSAQNNAQLTNLTNRQNVANTNVDINNKQQISNKGLLQQQFNNELGLGQARAGQYTNQANAMTQQAGQTAGMWAGIGQGVGTGLASLAKKANGNSSDTNTAF